MKRRFYVWSDKAIVKYNYHRDKEILLLSKINKKVQKNSLQTIFYLILYISGLYGSLAQLGEHLPYKQRVIGSSPITSTNVKVRNILFICGNGSVVERHLAKVDVAGSNLVSRSNDTSAL